MKKRPSLFRKILKGTGWFFLTLLGVELVLYFLVQVYDFPGQHPFSGEKIYNPYLGIDSTRWHKTNFHFHTRVWGGLTSGRSNSNEAFYRIYKALGYDAPQISNYQSINESFRDSSFYIPGYEHGFGIRKKHQVLIGSHQVLWLDYSIVQNLSHKQHMLNLLRPDNDVVAIAHPGWEDGYSLDDVRYLTNYDLLEALNHNWRSVPHWDAALSAGRPVYILSDDDAHDLNSPNEIQRNCTYVNSPQNRGADLVGALKSGKAFGVEVYMGTGETFAIKEANAKLIPRVNSVKVCGDTLWVSVSGKPLKITFIGQSGETRKIVPMVSRAWYKFTPGDNYIRTEIVFSRSYDYQTFAPGTIFYLNPVFRYDGTTPSNILLAEINCPRTLILLIFGFGSLAGLLAAGWFLNRKP
ncbi:MAG: hypothetical protein WCK34_16300 [Bacteroidota bacterium]